MHGRRRIELRGSLLRAALASAAIVTASAGSAAASDPFALYAVPRKVEMLPNDATATRVVIHGAILQLTTPQASGSAVYAGPTCGKMYFQCRAGDEDLCRMQWQDLRRAIDANYCAGFGTLNMVSSAKLLAESAALQTPDAWELGMGVTMATYLNNQCPKALMQSCPLDGGAGGAGGVGAGDVGGRSGNGGAGGAKPNAGGAGGGGASAGAGGALAGWGGIGGIGGSPASSGGASAGGTAGMLVPPVGSGGASTASGGVGSGGTVGTGGQTAGVDAAAADASGMDKKGGGGCSVAAGGEALGGPASLMLVVALAAGLTRRRARRASQPAR